jgi:hypothetical protein
VIQEGAFAGFESAEDRHVNPLGRAKLLPAGGDLRSQVDQVKPVGQIRDVIKKSVDFDHSLSYRVFLPGFS